MKETEKEKIPPGMTREAWEFHVDTQRRLLERFHYHEHKLQEEKAARAAQEEEKANR
jgi:hypothetical protein